MSGCTIIGAGGHAKVVIDILLAQGAVIRELLDDDPFRWETTIRNIPVRGPISCLLDQGSGELVAAIGSNQYRKSIVDQFSENSTYLFANAIHPSAVISPSVGLGRGLVLVAGSIINSDTIIGDHVIINTGVTIDHDCQVDAFAHVAPGVNLAGNVHVGSGALIGVGASVVPGCSIGAWSIVGAGAVVTKDIPPNCTAVGVPAKVIKEHEPG